MNKKNLSLLAAGLTALLFALSSCSGNSAEPGDSSIETAARLSVRITDNETGKPLKDASVTLFDGREEILTTDSAGFVVFNNVRVGTHQITVEKEGYAAYSRSAGIAGSGSGLFIARDSVQSVSLYPLNAKLEGFLFYGQDSANQKPAEGAKVQIVFSGADLVDRVHEATVGSGGKYAFEKLPTGNLSYTIKFLEFNGFAEESIQQYSLFSGKNDVPKHALSKTFNGSFTVISQASNSIIESDDDISFTFNDAVNVGEFSKGTNISFSSPNSYDITWSNGNKTLTLKLWPGHKWNPSFTIYLSSVKSVNGKSLNSNFSFKVASEELGMVTGLEVTNLAPDNITATYKISSISLKWNAVPGATNYSVLMKASKGDNKVVKVAEIGGNMSSAVISDLSELGLTEVNGGFSYEYGYGPGYTYTLVQANSFYNCGNYYYLGYYCGSYAETPYYGYYYCGETDCGTASDMYGTDEGSCVGNCDYAFTSEPYYDCSFNGPACGNYAKNSSDNEDYFYCGQAYCGDYIQVPISAYEPFKQDGEIEIVVQAIKGNQVTPYTGAVEGSSKITLKAAATP